MAERPDEVWDLLPAYALDAVDESDRRRVEQLLATDPAARRALDEYRETVAAFVVDTPPPPALRAEVLGRVATPPSVPSPAEASDDVVPLDRARRRRWGLVAAAAAAVVAVAVPTTVAVQARQEQVRLQAQADVITEMLADPSARIVTGAVSGGGEASVLVAGDRALFTTTALPATQAGEDYQLWVIDGSTITSAGVLSPRDGTVSVLVDAEPGRVVAVTVEPAGGSEQPTSDPVVALET